MTRDTPNRSGPFPRLCLWSAGVHPDDEILAAFVQGELEPTRAHEVEEHLAECPTCDAVVVEHARLSEAPRTSRYRLLGRLGSGSMGVVYAAWDERLDREVAIKLLRPALVGKAEGRLVDEARALAKLSHPNVVQVFDVGRWEGEPPPEIGDPAIFIAMERVDGWTFREWCEVSRPSADAVLDAIEAAGEALAAVHDAGFVHRDCKPDNLLMGRDGRVRVSDLGLARAATEAGQSHSGTPAYMAPEQREGKLADARSDQYALCLTLVEALTGERTSRRLKQAVMRGLSEDPAARYPDMQSFVDALRAARRAPSMHRGAHIAALAAITVLHVILIVAVGVEFAATYDEPFVEDPDEGLISLAYACILLLWGPLGAVLAPVSAFGLWRGKRWAVASAMLYAVLAAPTVFLTPYAVYAFVSLPRVRDELD